MTTVWATLLGALAGALFTFLASVLNASIQLRNTRENNQHQLKLDDRKRQAEDSRERTRLLREKCELAHQILSRLSRQFHQVSDIKLSKNKTRDDLELFYKRSDTYQAEFDDLRMIAELYVLEIAPTVEKIGKLASAYWATYITAIGDVAVGDAGASGSNFSNFVGEILDRATRIETEIRKAQGLLSERSVTLHHLNETAVEA